MDPDQTAPIGAVWSGSALFVKKASKNISADDKSRILLLFAALRFYFDVHQKIKYCHCADIAYQIGKFVDCMLGDFSTYHVQPIKDTMHIHFLKFYNSFKNSVYRRILKTQHLD